jgi:pyruvate,water dikinase
MLRAINPAIRNLEQILWFQDICADDVGLVGGKNASLGEMIRNLRSQGVNVPDGFAITAHGYRQFLLHSELDDLIRLRLQEADPNNVKSLARAGAALRKLILDAPIPPRLEDKILTAYRKLCKLGGGEMIEVAVRSSATAEDLPKASFAGQQETFLNIKGEMQLLEAVKQCFASLYTDRAISYRIHKGFDGQEIALSVGIQRMVRSDLASSGVMFTLDTESGFRNAILINASYGLGEAIVQGSVNPDEYYVFKSTLNEAPRPILRKQMGHKTFKLVYAEGGDKSIESLSVPIDDQQRFALSDDDILKLAHWGMIIEEHYSKLRGQDTPMDIEWAKDGMSGELYIVQARPETVHAVTQTKSLETFKLQSSGKVLVQGAAVGQRIAAGKVRIINDVREFHLLEPGEILVTDKTGPDWEPIMKIAAGIITNRGGRTCHAAIVSRELGIPAVVGTHEGTEVLREEQEITLSCAEGDVGKVYEGLLPFTTETVSLENVDVPGTNVMLNVANPSEAMRLSFLPNDGVGLARVEFIINNSIKIHPLALLDYHELSDQKLKHAIDELTPGYENKQEFFVDKLAEGVGMISAAFFPKPVIVRLSDFKTNEYAHLIGGETYEPKEENPMIGFRGASRYYSSFFKPAFALECRALAKAREEMGLTNIKVMVPFCRTIDEGRKVLSEMAANGLKQGDKDLEVYVMCEVPSNVILADQFAELFDGFSIGSNDLTQLTLGVDRDSEYLVSLFDERNEAVKRMVSQVIRTAHDKGRKIGICGQAPSDFPEYAAFLVEEGIDSISLNPDSVVQTRQMLANLASSRYKLTS